MSVPVILGGTWFVFWCGVCIESWALFVKNGVIGVYGLPAFGKAGCSGINRHIASRGYHRVRSRLVRSNYHGWGKCGTLSWPCFHLISSCEIQRDRVAVNNRRILAAVLLVVGVCTCAAPVITIGD